MKKIAVISDATTSNNKLRVTIYARYSSDGQREESIEGHLRECKDYAERQNMIVINTYVDRDVSARTDNRLYALSALKPQTHCRFECCAKVRRCLHRFLVRQLVCLHRNFHIYSYHCRYIGCTSYYKENGLHW